MSPVFKAAVSSGSSAPRSAVGLPPATSGKWFLAAQGTQINSASTSTLTTSGLCYFQPIKLSTGTLDRIAVNHFATTGAAGEVARLGIYSDSSGVPGALVIDGSTVDLSTAAAVKSVTISTAVTDGLYWLAVVKQGGSPTAALVVFNGIQVGFGGGSVSFPTDAASLFASGRVVYQQASVSGALPATATPVDSTFQTPIAVAVRYA